MRRRLITLATAAVLAVGGFTAAAVASGGNPFGILDDHAGSTVESTRPETSTVQSSTTQSTEQESTEQESTEQESTDDESTEEASTEEQETNEETTTETESESTTTATEHKVTICHHTGSTNHPFHEISVDEHAVDAHTQHGDTVGPCPAVVPTPTATTAHHGKKPKHEPRHEPQARPAHGLGHGAERHASHGHAGHGGGHGHGGHHGGK
jgi:hypothetical protein